MDIKLETFGTVECTKPALSTCFDLVSMWSDDLTRSTMGRLCAMAICQCGNDHRLPKIRHVVNTAEYGSKCLDMLLGAGVPVSQILECGMQCIGLMASALPSASEVKETENFTEPVKAQN